MGEQKKHQKALESLKSTFDSKLISSRNTLTLAHLFPYSGKCFLVETDADQDQVENHVQNDPYFKNGKIGELGVTFSQGVRSEGVRHEEPQGVQFYFQRLFREILGSSLISI